MLTNCTANARLESDVSNVEDLEGFSLIHQPNCAAVIWNRSESPAYQDWLNALPTDQLPNARMIIRPTDANNAIEEACLLACTPDCNARDHFVRDIELMVEAFVNLFDPKFIRLRLDVVTTNACKKFHVDYLKARLVCTLRGTGTNYGISKDGNDPQDIFTVPTRAPFLMRGKLWPNSPESHLLHRSPRIEDSGETRLVLVVDPLDEPVEEEQCC